MNNAGNLDWEKFEAAIQFLKTGIDTLFFKDVIRASTGHDVLAFNKESLFVIDSVDTWIKNNLASISNSVYSGFIGRANELGNKVEDVLRQGLNQIPNLKCDKPLLSSGKKQAAGYPDCLIESNGIKIYADIKIYQTKISLIVLRTCSVLF